MSGFLGSEMDRHAANLADVAANPANQYGLGHGYAILPDPNDPYGWQAFEQERSRRKTLEAATRREAAAAAGLLSQTMATATATTSTTAATRPSSCVALSSLSVCSSSCETSDDDEDDKRKKKQIKKTNECRGAACRSKTLSVHRAGPHWCDGKKWGGKIWGLTRTPGDRKRSNWHIYFDPKLSKTEVDAICRRRYRRSHHHHHHEHHRHCHHRRVKTKVVTVCGTCQGRGCMHCMPAGVFVPVDVDCGGDAAGYGGYGGYGYYGGGGLPTMPPHPGYSGHPAGNMEHWRVRDNKDKQKEKGKQKKDGSKGSKGSGSKDSKDSKDGSAGGGNTMGELAGRMQAMKCKEKGYWGGTWEKAADDMPKVTVGDLRLLAKAYQPTGKDGKGPGDDAAKWLWGTFGPDGGGGGRGGGGGMPFYGERETPVGGSFFGNYGGRERASGGGASACIGGVGGASSGGIENGGGQSEAAKSAGGPSGPSGSGRRANERDISAESFGGSRPNLAATVEDADNGQGSSNVSKHSPRPKGKGKERASEGAASVAASHSAASHHSPKLHSPRLHSHLPSRAPSPHPSASHHSVAGIDDATAADNRLSRFERVRQRLDDAGRLRTGSWERVSPAVQRERAWQRQQAMKEEWQKMQAEAAAEAQTTGRDADSPLLLRDEDERAIRDQLLSDTTSGGDAPPYPEHLGHLDLDRLAQRRAVSDTASYVGRGTTSSVGTRAENDVVSAHTANKAHSTSGDTGYETGHETGPTPAVVYSSVGRFTDPGYGSLYDIPGLAGVSAVSGASGAGFGDFSGFSGHGCDNNAPDWPAWGGVSSSSTTLLPSSTRSGGSKGSRGSRGSRGSKGSKGSKSEKKKEKKEDVKRGNEKNGKEHDKKGRDKGKDKLDRGRR